MDVPTDIVILLAEWPRRAPPTRGDADLVLALAGLEDRIRLLEEILGTDVAPPARHPAAARGPARGPVPRRGHAARRWESLRRLRP